MDTLRYAGFVICMEMTRLTDWERGYWVSEVIKAAGLPKLFIGSHHNKPAVVSPAEIRCFKKNPCRIYYFDSLSSVKVGNGAEREKHKAESFLRRGIHAEYLFYASYLPRNSH